MESETFWVIVVAVILILAPLYGYWMGTADKRSSWSAGKLGQVAVFAAVYSYTLLTAFFAAAKSSGIPMRSLLFSRRGDLGTELKGRSDLSIR